MTLSVCGDSPVGGRRRHDRDGRYRLDSAARMNRCWAWAWEAVREFLPGPGWRRSISFMRFPLGGAIEVGRKQSQRRAMGSKNDSEMHDWVFWAIQMTGPVRPWRDLGRQWATTPSVSPASGFRVFREAELVLDRPAVGGDHRHPLHGVVLDDRPDAQVARRRRLGGRSRAA